MKSLLHEARVLCLLVELELICACVCVCSSALLRQTTTVSELDRIISDICDDNPSINKVNSRRYSAKL